MYVVSATSRFLVLVAMAVYARFCDQHREAGERPKAARGQKYDLFSFELLRRQLKIFGGKLTQLEGKATEVE